MTDVPPFYCQKCLRLLTKSAAAEDLGASVCWMLAVISAQEDAKRYREPARFYYDQLLPLCGFRSRKQLKAAIDRAVDSGWLMYQPGRKGVPSQFSVRIPKYLSNLEPNACDEETFSSESEPDVELKRERKTGCSSESEPEAELNPHQKRNCNGRPSKPVPIPNPNTSSTVVDGAGVERKTKDHLREYSSTFERWWEAYPRKVGKPSASRAFATALVRIRREQLLEQEAALDWLLDRTRGFVVAVANCPYNKIPHGATWLNDDRYNDVSIVNRQLDDPYADLEYISSAGGQR